MNTFDTYMLKKPFDSSIESIFETLSDGLFTHSFYLHDDFIKFDPCTYANNAFLMLSGFSKESIISLYPNMLFKKVSDSFYEQALRDYISNKKSSYQTYLSTADNKPIPVILNVSVQETDGMLYATCVIKKNNSLTRNTDLPDTSADNNASQIDQMTVLSTLISGIAHEINNPNNIISLSTDLVRDIWGEVYEYIESNTMDSSAIFIHSQDIASLNQNVRNLLDNIISGSDRINRTISAVRDFVRMDSTERMTDCNIFSIIKSSLMLCDDLIAKSTSDFVVQCDHDIPHVMAYLRLVQQAIVNVVKNACEALTERSQKIVLSVQYQKETNSVLLSITDEGQGIAADTLPQIYNPFFTTKRNRGSLGLGLSVTQAIMNKHKGSISIDSKHGFGTTVVLRFPAVQKVLHQK
jgi:signal transduction histidine kinase